MKIITNKIQCLRCSASIESLHHYHFVACPCGAVAVDGGHTYLRRIGEPTEFTELSEVVEDVTPIETSDDDDVLKREGELYD